MNNRGARLAIFEVMNVVGRSRERVHGNGDGTDFCGAKESGNEFRRIRQHNQNAITTRNALGTQGIPGAIGERSQFAVGYFAWFASNRNAVRVQRGGSIEKKNRDIKRLREFRIHRLVGGSHANAQSTPMSSFQISAWFAMYFASI